MDSEDLQLEELHVSEPVSLPLHRLDLVVRTLQGSGRDGVAVVRQDPRAVSRQGLGNFLSITR